MIVTSSHIEIDRPRESVFEFLTDPAKAPLWQSGLLSIQGKKGMPAGSTGEMLLQVMGHRIVTRYEVLESDGIGRTLARSSQGPLKYETTQILAVMTPTKTRVTFQVRIDAGAVFKLAEPALESIVNSRMAHDLNTLRNVLESQD